MAEEQQGTAAGGLTKEDVQSLLADSLKSVVETVGELAKNQKIFADTLAKLPPAGAQGDAGTKEGDAAPLTAEAVTKLVADTLTADRQAQQQTAEQRAARDAFINDPANGIARLPDAYKAQLGSDPTKWAGEAKAAAGSWEKFVADNKIAIPDVGGAARDGGTAPEAGKVEAKPANDGALPDGLAKFAQQVDTQLAARKTA